MTKTTTKTIRFGTARRCITPEVPVSLAGYFNIRMWEKVLDDLFVRVLILKQNKIFFTLIQFDLVTVTTHLSDMLFSSFSKYPEITRKNTLITATHTHTGPEIRSANAGYNPEYLPFLIAQTVLAVQEAFQNMKEGEAYFGSESDNRFCYNRRYWMKDGTVVTNPGKGNTQIVRPEGEVDFRMPLFGIKSGGKWAVIAVNIVNHTDTIGGHDVSADWPGFFSRRIKERAGSEVMVFPLIGASGNINHFNVMNNENQTCYDEARRIGCGYADTALRGIESMQLLNDAGLTPVHCVLECGPREVTDAELSDAQKTVETLKDLPPLTRDLTSEDLAAKSPQVLRFFAEKVLAASEDDSVRVFHLTGFLMGGFAMLSLPCEPFVEIGLMLKQQLYPLRTMIVSHGNDTGNQTIGGGYIPNQWNYGRGGYETTVRSNQHSMRLAGKLIQAWSTCVVPKMPCV